MSHSFLKKFLLMAAACTLISPTAQAESETLTINQKTSHYMDMGQLIKRIAVGNPSIATVVQLPDSASEFLIVTKDVKGSTTLLVWTADNVRHEYLIVVSTEDPGQAMLIEQAINLPDVHVKMVDGRIMLTGSVENQYEKNQALQTARLFVDGGTDSSILVGSGFNMNLGTSTAGKPEANGKIIDLLQIRHPTQIRLEAQIIEINSDNAKDLGLQYGQSGSGGIFSFGENYTRDSHTYISESYSNDWSGSYNGVNSNNYNSSNTDSYNGSGSNNYSGSRNNSYSGNNTDSYTSNNSMTRTTGDNSLTTNRTTGNNGAYTGGYDNSYTNGRNNTYSNGYNNSYGNGYDSSYNDSINQSFSRMINSSWYDMVQFSNNPLKWITQHFAPINATLNLLVSQNKAKILSRPSVMTLSGEQATIQIGGEIPYSDYDENGKLKTDFKNYGIILQFKPVVDAQNRINSMIHAEVSNISGQTSNGQPILATRRADSVINLSSGSPIVIGGLMDSSETKTITKIPLLGDLPIIGEFFKHTSRSRDKREIIIVVTPYLVGEDEHSRVPMSKPMREWYMEDYDYRQAMDNFDFTRPYEEPEVVDDNGESDRILPPSRIDPKTGKIDDKKSKEKSDKNVVEVSPEEAEDPFDN